MGVRATELSPAFFVMRVVLVEAGSDDDGRRAISGVGGGMAVAKMHPTRFVATNLSSLITLELSDLVGGGIH